MKFVKLKFVGGWIPAQFQCAGSLGWDISGAAALELDIQIHSYSWNRKESGCEHIISSVYYAHHIIQQRKVHHDPAKVGIHSQRLTLLKRRAETFESLKPSRRAQVLPATSSELESARIIRDLSRTAGIINCWKFSPHGDLRRNGDKIGERGRFGPLKCSSHGDLRRFGDQCRENRGYFGISQRRTCFKITQKQFDIFTYNMSF